MYRLKVSKVIALSLLLNPAFVLSAGINTDGQRTYGTDDAERRSGLYDDPTRKSRQAVTPKKMGHSTERTSGRNENLQRDPGGNKKPYVSQKKKRKAETSKRVKADRKKIANEKQDNKFLEWKDGR